MGRLDQGHIAQAVTAAERVRAFAGAQIRRSPAVSTRGACWLVSVAYWQAAVPAADSAESECLLVGDALDASPHAPH
jgi:hypothetical protein